MSQPTQTLEQYDTLNNKTFYGLLIAEFLAAFNDQCIHASAMFFAIRKETLPPSMAIILMPMLFYLPWALFAPMAGYCADYYSKRTSLIFWKVAEIVITGVALLGLFLGAVFGVGALPELRNQFATLLDLDPVSPFAHFLGAAGPWIVMSAVFLMGTHSTFYVPNKYGVLPEIFTVRMLSRANGLIESTTFLAVILGTTTGGVLAYLFRGHEYATGLLLVVLAIIGTGTSYFIRRMPPADPNRPFPGWLPWQMFQPIFKSVAVLARSRLASVAILGLAFYAFVLVYMRSTMYMFGETRNPPWTEQDISLVVAVVSLGVGIGSPLAGFISGGKVELGLVPIGGVGIILALLLAGFTLDVLGVLVVSIALIGLFSSFYLVPLYSLLQYSAPKGSKGQAVATNNFICTAGSLSAVLVVFLIVFATRAIGLAEPLPVEDVGRATLTKVEGERFEPHAVVLVWDFDFHPKDLVVDEINSVRQRIPIYAEHQESGAGSWFMHTLQALLPAIVGPDKENVIKLDNSVTVGQRVAVSRYTLRGTTYYQMRPVDAPLPVIYNNELVPRFLFLGAAAMMLVVLVLLRLRLPDFYLRTYIFLRAVTRPIPRAAGAERVPFRDAVLVMNCQRLQECLPVLAGIVRPLRLILPEQSAPPGALLTFLAWQAGTLFVKPNCSAAEWAKVTLLAERYLKKGYLVAISSALGDEHLEGLLIHLQKQRPLPVVPVYCPPGLTDHPRDRTVQVGAPVTGDLRPDEIRRLLHAEIAAVPE